MSASRWFSQLAFRSRVLISVCAVFVALVGLRVHGSSIALAAQHWAPDEAMKHFVATPLLEVLPEQQAKRWNSLLMAEPRYVRLDEWAHETLWALAQFEHDPPFPIIHRNIGNGQNMLTQPWVPVAHVSAIARPMTWGYLLLGREHGLAWAWWFQVLSCFVALYLLFELIVPDRPWLGVLGAGWFCASAYVVFWSLWPAYTAGLGVFSTVFAYHALANRRRRVILCCAVLSAVAFAGFVMQLYPPWQIPLGYTFSFLFAGLVWRDRLWEASRANGRVRIWGLALAAAVAGLLIGAFLASSWDALTALANSEYPGKRRLRGGDCPGWRLFGGFFNAYTHDVFRETSNPSELAGFFLLLPALPIAAVMSPRIRRRLGLPVWCLLPFAAFLVYFCVEPIPEPLAVATLFSRVQGHRAQMALGLISIVLSVRLLAVASEFPIDRETLRTAAAIFVGCLALYLWQGIEFEAELKVFDAGPIPWAVALVSCAAAALSALLVLGRPRWFAPLLGLALAATSATFNPLSVGFADWRSSELGVAVRRVLEADDAPKGQPSLWLTFGRAPYPNAGMIALLMGARTLAGLYGHPQLDVWEPLDPTRANESKYNRFALVHLHADPHATRKARFGLAAYLILRVFVSPLHPALRDMGARYVLTFGEQRGVSSPPLTLIHASKSRNFAIWRLPDDP